MRGKIGDKERLSHILDAIVEIESYTLNVEFKDFISNSMMRFASIKQIEIIGMRHILIHEYFGVDANLV
jgi:uncharacterized protein with HEPN domain